jgi:hypothetical protein
MTGEVVGIRVEQKHHLLVFYEIGLTMPGTQGALS